jgi:glucose/arabinose dehydrogenase
MSFVGKGMRRFPKIVFTLMVLSSIAFSGCNPEQTGSGSLEVTPEPAHAKVSANAVEAEVPVVQGETKKYLVTPKDLPAPFATPSAENGSRIVPRPDEAPFHVPNGFDVKLWAKELENPRLVTVAPNGDVFVVESIPNRIRLLRDADGDGKPELRTIFADNLNQPFGMAFYPPGNNPQYLYVANTDSVVRIPYKSGDTAVRAKPEVIINDLPGGGYNQHWTRNLLFSEDGKKLYVSVGSQTNVGEEEEKRAAILEYNPDGTEYRVFASGIRNPVGMAWHPITKKLWTACNERDGLGDDLVPDFATEVKEGGFYSWPWYYIGQNHDPRMPEKPALKAKAIVPDVLFQSHVAALGLHFYTGNQFPEAYRNSAYVALHGSWNRSKRTGYAIARIAMDAQGKPTGGYEDFVSGWALPDGRVWGRPVGLAELKDGSLLVTDDATGKVWVVRYKK